MDLNETFSAIVDSGSGTAFDTTRAVVRSASQVRRIEQVCLIGSGSWNIEIIAILKEKYGVEIFESKTGEEYLNIPNMVFVFENFTGCPYFKRLNASSKLIIGPALIRNRALLSKPMLMPRPNRPLYSETMTGVTIVLSGMSNRQCREAVDLIHFMGGSARKQFSPATTHLITESATGKTYRMAISMGCRAMHFEWLRAAWDVRDEINVSVTDINFMAPFILEPFCSLALWFVGFDDAEAEDMRKKTAEHKGRVAKSQQEATHIVVSNLPSACIEDAEAGQHVVTGEWFWVSIQLNCCANEELYLWKGHKRSNRKRTALPVLSDQSNHSSKRTPSRSSLDNLESSNSSALPDYSEHAFSSEDIEKIAASPRKADKRLMVCREMLETEENYLQALKIMVQSFKEPLEMQLNNPESGLLSKAEITQIFSRIPPLIEAHEKICDELKSCIMQWNPDRRVGKVWLNNAEIIGPLYKSYINSYDTACQTLEQCDRMKPKFHAFLKAAESRADCRRNHLSDLLVRPVQRLPSVVLLLKAVLKNTDRSNQDYTCLVKASKEIEGILSTANQTRERTDSYIEIFQITSEIDRCPAEVLSSARKLTGELHAVSLGGEEFWAKTRGKNMAFFLFNDLIQVTKARGGMGSSGDFGARATTSTISRQFSFTSLRQEKKKYKHLQMYLLSSVRQINVINYRDISGVFTISFRAADGEIFLIAQSLESEMVWRNFLEALAGQIFLLCNRKTPIEERDFNAEEPVLGNEETVAAVFKALHHAMPTNYAGSSQSFVRPQSHFRRAVSSVSLGISQTLSRFHSRHHLAPINESFSSQVSNSPVGQTTNSHRSLKQMISSGAFTPLKMTRRGSIRTTSTNSTVV